ncbi:hypothetical protein C2G38_2241810 [Gigaspora rosea]|uniref:SWIM-type domain-containing protein n=1 Tax=Gigaspora rosea TaxID=44941 RepID=A0A397VQH4_9GLOM|nr:hypothetical protein C2G38_2241810 [Gigaspora rosea]
MYFYVKKVNNKFRSPYTMRDICIDGEIYQLFQPMLNILASKHPVAQEDNYYLVNISTGECTCLDFIWNGSFRNVCKHVYAARLFNNIENNKIAPDVIKHDLVLHFRNKECAMPNELKNNIIYSNSDDAVFEEILRIYSEQGNDIFFPYEHGVTEKDPFHPAEMQQKRYQASEHLRYMEQNHEKLINFLVDNVPMILDNEVELSNVLEPKETSAINTREVLRPLAPSVQKRLTTAIRNRKRSISNKLLQDKINVNITPSKKTVIRSALEALFVEKGISWKRCEFVKACIEQNISLDDNAELNKKKLFTWFDGKKTKEKQISKL